MRKIVLHKGRSFLCATADVFTKTTMANAPATAGSRGTENASAADGLRKKLNGWKPKSRNLKMKGMKMLDRVTAVACLFAALFLAVQVGIGIGLGGW